MSRTASHRDQPGTLISPARSPLTVDAELFIAVVCGAHPRAELEDRPTAYLLCREIQHWLAEHEPEAQLTPLVCTDLWYLNAADLMNRPTIALGGPEVNAATAYLATRLPTAFMVDQVMRIHLDPEMLEPRACLWGVGEEATSAAARTFIERYLEEFLRAST